MQSIVANEESLERVPSKFKASELVDNDPVAVFAKKPQSEVDTADSSKQKAVTFSIPPELKEQEKSAQAQISINFAKVSEQAAKPVAETVMKGLFAAEAKPEVKQSLFDPVKIPASSGGMFGAPQKMAEKPLGLFDKPEKADAKPITGLLGAPVAGSLFDKPQEQQTGGLFDKPKPAESTGSLFDKPKETTGGLFQQKPAADGLFGKVSEAKESLVEKKPENSLFSKPAET